MRLDRTRFAERSGKIEVDLAAADGTVDLSITFAQVAVLVVWQRLVLRLLGQRVCDAVRQRSLLGEQQEEGEQRAKEDLAQHATHCNFAALPFQVKMGAMPVSEMCRELSCQQATCANDTSSLISLARLLVLVFS